MINKNRLLIADGIINLLLGVLLLTFLSPVVNFLGVPFIQNSFYARILGGVLLGIGIALLIEVFHNGESTTGLGLRGAIAINICGGLTLAALLIWSDLSISIRGDIILWGLVCILVGISLLELFMYRKSK